MKKYLKLLEFLTFLHGIAIGCDLVFVGMTQMGEQFLH